MGYFRMLQIYEPSLAPDPLVSSPIEGISVRLALAAWRSCNPLERS